MKIGRAAGLGLRFAVLAAILAAAWIYRGGVGDVLNALHAGGWAALAAVCGWHLIALFLCAAAEWSLSPGIRIGAFIATRWVHEAVGELTGFIPLSGEVAAGRMLSRCGVGTTKAAALTVVDLTAEALGQFVFTAIGIAFVADQSPDGRSRALGADRAWCQRTAVDRIAAGAALTAGAVRRNPARAHDAEDVVGARGRTRHAGAHS